MLIGKVYNLICSQSLKSYAKSMSRIKINKYNCFLIERLAFVPHKLVEYHSILINDNELQTLTLDHACG